MSPSVALPNLHQVVVASTFTAERLMVPLTAWLRWLGIPGDVRFAPYNQLFQQLLDPQSLLTANTGGTNVLLLRVEDWSRSGDLAAAARHADEFATAVEQFTSSVSCELLVGVCPSSGSLTPRQLAALADIERQLIERLARDGRVQTFVAQDVDALYPVSNIDDPLAGRAGQIPYSQAYFVALATFIVRRLSRHQRPPVKVIAVDCDNTLWDGVCGEVGPQGVVVSPEKMELQRRLLELRDAGFLLCLCSKNNPQDAWDVFDENAQMLLQRQHLTAARLSWEPKSESLRELAAELKLGLDSFVFLDDNPVEVVEVRAHLPQVLALELPPQGLQRFMRHIWGLDRWSITAEDRQRADHYAQEFRRQETRHQAPSLEQFLQELQLTVEFLPLDAHWERAAQLTQRTNQFNFTTRRRSAGELRALLASPGQAGFLVQAADKFGDYGLVGLVLYAIGQQSLQVDTFLLSCRALGRRIETEMLAEVGRRTRQAGLPTIEFQLIETEKNHPACGFVRQCLGDFKVAAVDAMAPQIFAVDVGSLELVVGRALAVAADAAAPLPRLSAKPGLRPQASELMNRIAAHLNSVENIFDALRSEAPPRPNLETVYAPPRTTLEQRVAAICRDVLHLRQVGMQDGLKELGASSLHVVQIYSQLEREFAAGLNVTDLFALPTLETIVDRLQAGCENHADRPVEKRSAAVDPASIAVIGMAGRFPGATNVTEFWGNITGRVCSIVEIPETELNLPQDSPLRKNPNLVRKSAAIRDADKFDAKFFGIFPKEATAMDPQHRLFLEHCWHAIEDAGYNVDSLVEPVGVFAGCYMDTYLLASLSESPKWLESLANAFHGGDLLTELGNDKDYLATRVAFLLNLCGPAITVQTACSTSLVAIAQACQSLVSRGCRMALAGGVTLKLPQHRGYLYTEGGMVSPDGVCRTFDARARGTVFGEGCGVVLLKRLEDALADGDDIYAVIKGWGLNNDGRAKLGYTAPSVAGQAGAIEMAQRMAGVSADTITLVEAHGTGTSLGDPIEIEALTRVFRKTSDRKQYCAIGSVKPNVGHLDVAAGVTGLIKTSLALRYKVLPPSLNFEQPNPNIDFPNSPFYVNTQLSEWSAPAPRRAGISSFGVGGTNAHLVVEEAPPLPASTALTGPQLLTLSARSPAALDAQRQALVQHLRNHRQINLADVAYTLQTGRKTFSHSLVTVVRTVEQAITALEHNSPPQVVQHKQIRRGKSVVFMFPGQGAQHCHMARDLFETDSIFRAHFDRCAELLLPHLGFDIREKVYTAGADQTAGELNQTVVAQTSIFSVSYALTKCLERSGIRPRRMLGHSVGEFVAACLAGVFSLEDALRLIAFRALHMQQLPAGTMMAVRLSEAELTPRLSSDLSLAAINGPLMCVVSGPTAAIDKLQGQLEAAEVVCRRLHTSHAFHSAMMDPVVEPFAAELQQVALRPPSIPIISSVTGRLLSDSQAVDPWYWARHLRETVRFTDALALEVNQPDAVLLEVGPGQTLCTLARQHPDRDVEMQAHAALPHAKQLSSASEHLLLALGRLWQSGVDVDWKLQFADQQRLRLHLPGYPFERQRYWLEAETDASVASHSPSQIIAQSAEGEAITQRVIEQQLQLMQQQLEVWQRSL